MANSNQRNNYIEMLLVDGLISTDQEKSQAQFYDDLFAKEFVWRPKLDGLVFLFGWGRPFGLRGILRRWRYFFLINRWRYLK